MVSFEINSSSDNITAVLAAANIKLQFSLDWLPGYLYLVLSEEQQLWG